MMKKIVLVAVANSMMLVLQAQDGFIIKGKLKGQDNHKMSLMYQGSNKQLVIDSSAVAKNGSFEIKGEIGNEPVVAFFNTKLDRNIYMTRERKGMFVPAPSLEVVLSNKARLKVSGTAEDINLSTVKGDVLNESFNKLRKAEEAVVKESWQLQQQAASLRIEGKKEEASALGKRTIELRDKRIAIRKQFVQDNPAAFASVYLLGTMGLDYTPGELEQAYNHLSETYKHTSYAKAVASKIEAGKATAIGKIAPDFMKKDVNGNPFQLSSLKGKYVLVDFWGSWCGPCRASHPHLKEVYAKYKDKGFEILGIANEKNAEIEKAKAAWTEAIGKDGVTWKQVLNNDGGEQPDVTKLYGIEGYPTKLLLDKEGKVIVKWVGMESTELDAKLKEIFGE
jgi:thiol-disulfide isomerase/thioredoxin